MDKIDLLTRRIDADQFLSRMKDENDPLFCIWAEVNYYLNENNPALEERMRKYYQKGFQIMISDGNSDIMEMIVRLIGPERQVDTFKAAAVFTYLALREVADNNQLPIMRYEEPLETVPLDRLVAKLSRTSDLIVYTRPPKQTFYNNPLQVLADIIGTTQENKNFYKGAGKNAAFEGARLVCDIIDKASHIEDVDDGRKAKNKEEIENAHQYLVQHGYGLRECSVGQVPFISFMGSGDQTFENYAEAHGWKHEKLRHCHDEGNRSDATFCKKCGEVVEGVEIYTLQVSNYANQ